MASLQHIQWVLLGMYVFQMTTMVIIIQKQIQWFFFALKRFLDPNPNVCNGSMIINCPEADNVTTLSLEDYLINDIINVL